MSPHSPRLLRASRDRRPKPAGYAPGSVRFTDLPALIAGSVAGLGLEGPAQARRFRARAPVGNRCPAPAT